MLGREVTGVFIHGTVQIQAPSLWMINSKEALFLAPHVLVITTLRLVIAFKTTVINQVKSSESSWHKTQYNSHFPIHSPAIFTLHTYRRAP